MIQSGRRVAHTIIPLHTILCAPAVPRRATHSKVDMECDPKALLVWQKEPKSAIHSLGTGGGVIW